MALANAYSRFEEERQEIMTWLEQEIATLRTGRVTPNLVENIAVEYYGSRTPLKGVASVTGSDARTLTISPWDGGAVAAIAKAITEAELGVQPNVDGILIRLIFPSLTEEARTQTVKVLHKRAEEARVRLRQARDEALKEVRLEKEQGALTEDDFYQGKEKLDELIGGANGAVEALVGAKEKDILAV